MNRYAVLFGILVIVSLVEGRPFHILMGVQGDFETIE